MGWRVLRGTERTGILFRRTSLSFRIRKLMNNQRILKIWESREKIQSTCHTANQINRSDSVELFFYSNRQMFFLKKTTKLRSYG